MLRLKQGSFTLVLVCTGVSSLYDSLAEDRRRIDEVRRWIEAHWPQVSASAAFGPIPKL